MINQKGWGIDKINTRKLVIEYVKITDLVPNTYNPNRHETVSFDMLIKSISMFGFTQPIVARKVTNEIIDGEHRWRAAAVLEIMEVPVCFIELTDEEMRIATIMHNAARGSEDKELMNKISTSLKEKGIDLDKTLLKHH